MEIKRVFLQLKWPFTPWFIDGGDPITTYNHQEFQVPKMEVLNLIRLFWGWGFPYISRIHTAYMGFRIPPF